MYTEPTLSFIYLLRKNPKCTIVPMRRRRSKCTTSGMLHLSFDPKPPSCHHCQQCCMLHIFVFAQVNINKFPLHNFLFRSVLILSTGRKGRLCIVCHPKFCNNMRIPESIFAIFRMKAFSPFPWIVN